MRKKVSVRALLVSMAVIADLFIVLHTNHIHVLDDDSIIHHGDGTESLSSNLPVEVVGDTVYVSWNRNPISDGVNYYMVMVDYDGNNYSKFYTGDTSIYMPSKYFNVSTKYKHVIYSVYIIACRNNMDCSSRSDSVLFKVVSVREGIKTHKGILHR